MIALIGSQVVDLLRQLLGFSSSNSEAKEFSERIVEHVYTFKKAAADGMASTATAETLLDECTIRHPGKVVALRFTPAAALTADASNNAVITVQRRPASAPGTPATVLAYTTNVAGGNWTAWLAKDFLGATTPIDVLKDDVLTVTIAKGGTGVVVPAGVLEVVVL